MIRLVHSPEVAVILEAPKPEVARSVHITRFAFVTALCALLAVGVMLLTRW